MKKRISHKTPIIKDRIWLLAILIGTAILYLSSLNNGFVDWDDDWYIQQNPQITELTLASVPDLFTEFYKGQYAPVTTLLLGIEYKLGSGNPAIMHITSLLLHLLNILLVFTILRSLKLNPVSSLLAAALFALHPMQVESVSWISAQKVVLYTLFFLLALIYYIKYVQSAYQSKYLILVFLFFILSFLSKEQAVTLSISLIAIDYYLQRNLFSKKVILEKIPFLIVSVILGIITIQASKTGEFFQPDKSFPVYEQLAYSGYALTMYLSKMIVPFKLSAFHPYPNVQEGVFQIWLYLFIIPAILLVYFTIKSWNRNRLLVFAILFFMTNMILVLQLLPLRDFIMADRYIYIPSIGLFALFGDAVVRLAQNKKRKNLSVAVMSVAMLLYAFNTYGRSKVWKDSYTLFTDVIEKYPTSSVGWNNRALANANLNRHELAVQDYKKSIQYNPNSLFAYNNLGISLTKLGRMNESIRILSNLIEMEPTFSQAYFNLADAYSKNNMIDESIATYSKFLSLKPDYSSAYVSRGILYAKSGKFNLGLEDLNKAILLDPENLQGYLNRGVIHLNLKSYKEAISDFSITLRMKPQFDYAYFNRGLAKIFSGDKNGGCSDLNKSAQLGFNQAQQAMHQYCSN
jgi:tetratricopeptide (TPR) repeat protein